MTHQLVTCYVLLLTIIMVATTSKLQNVIKLYVILLLVWGFYRVLFKLPDYIEELVFKPLLWLGALYWFLQKEKSGPVSGFASVGWTAKNIFSSIYLGIGLGVVFAVMGIISNIFKYEALDLSDFGFTANSLLGGLSLSFITAVSEETVFRGYFFSRAVKALKSEWSANILVSFGWVLIHLPVLFFVYDLSLSELPARALLSFIFSLGAGFVYGRTGNILAPVLLNVFWSWPIILFR